MTRARRRCLGRARRCRSTARTSGRRAPRNSAAAQPGRAARHAAVESNRPGGRAVRGDDLLATLAVEARHIRLTAVHLHDITDHQDFLVEERSLHTGHLGCHSLSGNLLECVNAATGDSLLLARLAPTPEAEFTRLHGADFQWLDRLGVGVYGTGIDQPPAGLPEVVPSYGLVLLAAPQRELRGRWRAHYRGRMQPAVFARPLCLANTWGDRNQDAAINAAFVERELAALEETGIRGLMLDDGWQAGRTANSKLRKGGLWEGYHAADSAFWTIDPEKFPGGLGPVVAAAMRRGRELALWFSPDSAADFANWEKDAAILLGLHREHGIRAVKLDGVKLRSRLGEQRFGRLLEALRRGSGGAIVPVLDVTAEIRPGYLREIGHGVLFMETATPTGATTTRTGPCATSGSSRAGCPRSGCTSSSSTRGATATSTPVTRSRRSATR